MTIKMFTLKIFAHRLIITVEQNNKEGSQNVTESAPGCEPEAETHLHLSQSSLQVLDYEGIMSGTLAPD